MNLKQMNTEAGSIFAYPGYLILSFVWYMINSTYPMLVPESMGTPSTLGNWALKLLVAPVVLAIFFGGIHERQTIEDDFERTGFLAQIKQHGLRFFIANLFSFVFSAVGLIAVFLIAGQAAMQLGGGNLFPSVVRSLTSTIMLF
jgi:hypothetical protein